MDNQNQDEQKTPNSGLFSGAAAPADAEISPQVDPSQERELLMQRARLLGIEFSNNIGTETLRQRINAKLDEPEDAPPPVDAPNALAAEPVETNALTGQSSAERVHNLRQELYDEQMKLVRVRITCMDPKKKDLHGEIFTIANEYIGTVRKFVPFGEATEDGYHIPYCIYTMLEERKFLNIRTVKNPRTGSPEVQSNYAKEFAIEVLPQLTPDELKRLALAQAAAGSVD